MKIVAIVQARMGSTRLPNKVMQPVRTGMPIIEVLLSRLSKSTEIDKIVLATSNQSVNQPLVDHVEKLGYSVFQGSENDVLDRYYQAAKSVQATEIVRITGDCPLIDPNLVDQVIELFHDEKADYASNTNPPTYPDGLDVSICTFNALEKAWQQATTKFDREHVMPFIRRNSDMFRTVNLTNQKDQSKERWTVDEPEDMKVVQNIFNHFVPDINFSWKEVIQLRNSKPQLFSKNQHLTRNEGARIGSGQKLWKRAKRIIPGGNMLLSKRPEMFLPDKWPAYYSKAKGCKVWDLDGNEYTDMSIMGIGTNVLGYANDEVDDVVRKVIDKSNSSTFNCPEEVYLAEKLVELHPWADMVRFARAGGEACSIAIRIARAASGRDKVAFCGYHGWQDWYLSANLSEDSNLEGHLLPGLEPKGVPRNLKDTAIPFTYNNIAELKAVIQNHDVGVIIMEVIRNQEPKDNFLQAVRDLATKHNIVLVFDEISSGFRSNFGGIHLTYNVNPDMAVFGKAMGNGYTISAVVGKKEVMEYAQSSFISSTFWTERIGPTAALATLEVMARERSWEQITNAGNQIATLWRDLADKYNLPIRIYGLPSMIKFDFDTPNSLYYKTLITQEMLIKGYLAGNCVYVCIKHTPDVLLGYARELEDVFKVIRECEDGRNVMSLLKGPVCHAEFKRLN